MSSAVGIALLRNFKVQKEELPERRLLCSGGGKSAPFLDIWCGRNTELLHFWRMGYDQSDQVRKQEVFLLSNRSRMSFKTWFCQWMRSTWCMASSSELTMNMVLVSANISPELSAESSYKGQSILQLIGLIIKFIIQVCVYIVTNQMLRHNLVILCYSFLLGYFLWASPPSSQYITPQTICSNIEKGFICAHCFEQPEKKASEVTVRGGEVGKVVGMGGCGEKVGCGELVQLVEYRGGGIRLEDGVGVEQYLEAVKGKVEDINRQMVLGEGRKWAVLTFSKMPNQISIEYQPEPLTPYLSHYKAILFCVSLILCLYFSKMSLLSFSVPSVLTPFILIFTYLATNTQHLSQPNLWFTLAYSLFIFSMSLNVDFSLASSLFTLVCILLIEWFRYEQVYGEIVICLFLSAYLFVVLMCLFLNIDNIDRPRMIALCGMIAFGVSYVSGLVLLKTHDTMANSLVNVFALNLTPVLIEANRQTKVETVKPYRVSDFQEDMQEVSQLDDIDDTETEIKEQS